MGKIKWTLQWNLGLAIVIACIAMTLIIGGTFAYFNDVEDTNNTFASGTLELKLEPIGGAEDLNIHLENMKPGDGETKQFRLSNEGTLGFKDVKIHVGYTISDGDGNTGTEEFADFIQITILDLSLNKTIITSTPLSNIHPITLAENFAPGNSKDIQVQTQLDESIAEDSRFKGYQFDFQIILEAAQQPGVDYLTNQFYGE